jgi:DNA-directed RNA polymerase III subunit RPC1
MFLLAGDSVKDALWGKGLNEYVDLELPVFAGYFKAVTAALQTICKTCLHVLLMV